MKVFLKRLMLFSIPILLFCLIIVGSFFMFDPFMILRNYEEFNTTIVNVNSDYVATERYLKHKQKYDSILFGSSRAGSGFNIPSWGKAIKAPNTSYSFAAFNESIFGILGKVRLIDEEGGTLKNVLLVFDSDLTFSKYRNSTGHLFIKHPRISKETKQSFIMVFLKDYISSGFFIAYLDYKIFRTKRDYMKDQLMLHKELNNERLNLFDCSIRNKQILEDEEEYFRKPIFYERGTAVIVCERKIKVKGIGFLKEIKEILSKHKTDYRIAISPLYDQKQINPKDLSTLEDIFGKEYIFDYSGHNRITDDKHNYYETSHYRPMVGELIISDIYLD